MAASGVPSEEGSTSKSGRSGWLRAATLGADDGLISTSSLVVGVASAQGTHSAVLLAALAGLVSGALSMAAGEYVSVSTQADAEKADLALESREQAESAEEERAELSGIYQQRGVSADVATPVAEELMAQDALGAHAKDELGIEERTRAHPIQAAGASAASFALGAAIPTLLVAFVPHSSLALAVVIATVVFLLVLGGTAARLGGAPMVRGALRVAFWGLAAMGVTALVGSLAGTVV